MRDTLMYLSSFEIVYSEFFLIRSRPQDRYFNEFWQTQASYRHKKQARRYKKFSSEDTLALSSIAN